MKSKIEPSPAISKISNGHAALICGLLLFISIIALIKMLIISPAPLQDGAWFSSDFEYRLLSMFTGLFAAAGSIKFNYRYYKAQSPQGIKLVLIILSTIAAVFFILWLLALISVNSR